MRLFGIFGSRKTKKKKIGDKKKKKNPRRLGLGIDIKKTCANIQGLSLQNGVNIWTFVRKSLKFAQLPLLPYFSFSIRSTLGSKHDLILALRCHILRYLRETYCRRACHRVPAIGVFRKKKWKKQMLFSYANA